MWPPDSPLPLQVTTEQYNESDGWMDTWGGCSTDSLKCGIGKQNTKGKALLENLFAILENRFCRTVLWQISSKSVEESATGIGSGFRDSFAFFEHQSEGASERFSPLTTNRGS